MNFIFLNICGALNCHYQIVHENVWLMLLQFAVMRLFCLYDLYDEYEPSPATSTVVTRLKRIHHPGYCWVIVTKYHIFAQIPQIGYLALTQPNTATFPSTSCTSRF